MIVEIDGVKYYVHWRHITNKSKKGTHVFISTKPFKKDEELEPLVTAKSHLHKGDVFSKNIGRIKSLTKALESKWPGSQNKGARTAFWSKYAEMRGSIG